MNESRKFYKRSYLT
ncbi:unnamed protein product, partial [Allacma fusca]